MDNNNYNLGWQNPGGYRGGRGSGRGGQFQQFNRKRHRSRSPENQMYQRPRFDEYSDNSQQYNSAQQPFGQFDTSQESYFTAQHNSSFGNQQDDSFYTDSYNAYGGSHQPNRPHDNQGNFGDDMSYFTPDGMQMDQGQHNSQGYGKRGNGRGRGNSWRGGASRGYSRGNANRGWNRNESNRGNNNRTNFNRRGGNRGNRGGQNQRGKPRGQGTYDIHPDKQMVHSLAKLEMPDPTGMSIAEKLKRFGLFLKTVTPKANAIQTIQNALSASKLLMTSEYDNSVLLMYAGRPMFTGCLHIGGQFIVRAVGPTKREVKHDVYNQALEILTTETVHAILSRVDRPEELKETLLENLQKEDGGEGLATPQSEFEAAVGPLITTIKTLLPALNSISTLEQAKSMSHCPLKSSCTFEEADPEKPYFTSNFWLEDTLIAIGQGRKKKEAKHSAYENAIKALTTRSFEELESGKNVEGCSSETLWVEKSSDLLEQEDVPGNETVTEEMPGKLTEESFDLETQLVKLIDQLKEYIFKANNVHKIDCLAVKLSLTPVCVYRKIPSYTEKGAPIVGCDLYISDIFIASSESTGKKDAQLQTYQKAWEFLTTTPVDSILTEQPRKPEISLNDPAIIEVVRKGAGKYGDSNIERLGRYLINVYENWKSVDEIIIMEHVDWIIDRERHAFGILSQSATLTGLLMEWKIVKDELTRIFKCSMFLQKEEVAWGKSLTKNGARNKACAKAMNKFYQTQPIIQMSRKEETPCIHLWEDIKESAKTWRSPEGESSPFDASGELTSEHILSYCKHLLKEKLDDDTLEGVVFKAGMTLPECRALKQHAVALKMKSEIQQNSGLPDLIVSKKVTPDVMVKCLRRNNNRSGRYVLLTDQQRPHLHLSDNSQPAAVEGEETVPGNSGDGMGVIDNSQ